MKKCYFLDQENKTCFWPRALPLLYFLPRAKSEVPGSGGCTKLLSTLRPGAVDGVHSCERPSPPSPRPLSTTPVLTQDSRPGSVTGARGGWQTLNSYHSYWPSREWWENQVLREDIMPVKKMSTELCPNVSHCCCFSLTEPLSTLHPFRN